MKCENSGSHSFPGQSLLLSTTVLNDIGRFSDTKIVSIITSSFAILG